MPRSDLGNYDLEPVPTLPVHLQEIEYSSFQPPGLFELIQKSCPNSTQVPIIPISYRGASSIQRPTPELWTLVKVFQASSNQCQQKYGNGLSYSVQALDDLSTSEPTTGRSDFSASFDWQAKGNAVLQHQDELENARDALWNEIPAL
ncbi:hypothetical protein N7491_010408 [Penicillium cf. griseofulvum]|uniref:Uncharacterized protein n=1 Tax=Penicillium cf. griseofulvum TaxID=2972120 RepID=A0A9W9MZW7_9EURO|nr:hypothetical protein N7472_000740 [Penicillium cf. griseofulvum]KAJ5421963.1 hypothetical protein N7491_010408 [Penicillium cf. griseofulvum]KAJ5428154.1 hypothetical protein N7445_009608 [Penicillium cf. griseofulvum]